jgi:hypothetical protein
MKATLEGEHPAVAKIKQLVGPETVLAVWGWGTRLYVDTQLPQATSESLTYYQIAPRSLQGYYLSRFVAEIASHNDVIFVDITGNGGTYLLTEPEHDHSQFKSVKQFVDERLEYVDTVGGARIFRTKRSSQ